MRRFYSLLAVFAWLTLFGSPLIAEENPPPIDPAAELQAAMEEVNATLRPGPQDIDVVSQARLNLPAKYAFVPAAAAARLLTAFGNRPGNDLVGLVVPNNSDDWLLVIRYTAIGSMLLTVWFGVSILLLPNLGHATVLEWLARPVPATAMALLFG
ncbi:MAG TPA: DUF2167 domain-containing protein, partial [Accumulibacter sp.]|nr:DUF2167 domain-containing protein [Accumulibacter sp.]